MVPDVPHLRPACATRQAWPGSLLCPPSTSGSLLQLSLAGSLPSEDQPLGGESSGTLAVQVMEDTYETTHQELAVG